MKQVLKKWWFYLIILMGIIIIISIVILLKNDNDSSKKTSSNFKPDILDIDDSVYVVEDDVDLEDDNKQNNINDEEITNEENKYNERENQDQKNNVSQNKIELENSSSINNSTLDNSTIDKESTSSINNKESNNSNTSNSNLSETKYTCPYGYELIGDKCYKNYLATIEYKCSEGTVAGAFCVIDKSTTANATYTCPEEYTLSGTDCIKNVLVKTYNSSDYEHLSASVQSSYYNSFLNYCSGTNMIRVDSPDISYCYETKYTIPTITYDCNGKEGTLAGNGCVNIVYEDAFAFPTCPDGGYLNSDTHCRVSIDATKK